LDNYENNAYDIQNELLYKHPDLKLDTVIANIREKQRMENIFKKYRPDVVFHAAAHKHVPLMEDNPTEAIKNNVFGTLNGLNVRTSMELNSGITALERRAWKSPGK